jgi:hypothetical protein
MKQQADDDERIAQEVEKRVEKRVASIQASLLAYNQGQEGQHAQHGEALSKFPTRPDPNQLAYHAAMVEEARRDTNSSTFSYDLRDNEVVVPPTSAPQESAPRSPWPFSLGYPGYSDFRDYPRYYSDRSRNADEARQRESHERSRQAAEARQREVEHAELM